MELRHLRYFVAVAEELHFGRAAARLYVSQPSLSQQIRKLERELGVTLLTRARRAVALTEPGRAFLAEARRTLAAAEDAVRAARLAGEGRTGRLRVGYVDLANYLVLPDILRAYRNLHPEVDLTIVEAHREPQRERLARGELDLGIFTLRHGDGPFEGLRIAEDPLVAALPAGHAAALHTQVEPAHLRDSPWVLFPPDMRTRYVELVHRTCAEAGFVPRVVQEARQLHTLAALVSAGIGVSLLPRSVAAAPRAGLVIRPLAGAEPVLHLDLVWRAGDRPPTADRFVDVAHEVVRRGPPAGVRALDHTADVALELEAPDFATLLERAALGMDWLLRGEAPPPPPFETRELDLGGRGRDPALALRELLRELLRWHERDGFAPAAIEVVGRRGGHGLGMAGGRREREHPAAEDSPSDDAGREGPGAGTLRVRVSGAPVEARPLREIKGVTLHGLAAEPREGRWWGRVVFDV